MYKHPWGKILIAAILVSGCGSGTDDQASKAPAQAQQPGYSVGWSHNCVLSCTNVDTNQVETVERQGVGSDLTPPVCAETKLACEAERATSCANSVAITNNEMSYDNCSFVSAGECVEGCIIRR